MASRRLYVAASRLPIIRKFATGNGPWELRQMATAASRDYGDVTMQGDRRSSPLYRRRRRRDRDLSSLGMFQDLWDPFLSSRSLKQMMDTVDRVFDDSLRTLNREIGEEEIGVRTPWDVKSNADAYFLRVDMPGLTKDEVNVNVEDGELIIKGEPSKKHDEGWGDRSYGNYLTRVTLPDDTAVDQIKAEMKNGVLKIVIPKVKEDAKGSVINVQVD